MVFDLGVDFVRASTLAVDDFLRVDGLGIELDFVSVVGAAASVVPVDVAFRVVFVCDANVDCGFDFAVVIDFDLEVARLFLVRLILDVAADAASDEVVSAAAAAAAAVFFAPRFDFDLGTSDVVPGADSEFRSMPNSSPRSTPSSDASAWPESSLLRFCLETAADTNSK